MKTNELPLDHSEQNPEKEKHETYSLLIMISTPKKAEDMANYALANGAVGAFFSYARGTLPSHILSMLGLANVQREIVALAVPSRMAESLLEQINVEFNLKEKLGGIAYLISLERAKKQPTERLGHSYSMIATIVNEGEGEDVVEQVRQSHPVGASILQATGSADHSRKTFNFEIVPSKEIVLIIAKRHQCEAIYRTINESLRTEMPGRGIIFSTDIDMVAGILEKDQELKLEQELFADSVEPQDHKATVTDESHQVAVLALVDRGFTGEIIRLAEAEGSHGATIMRGRFTAHESRGFFGHSDEIEKEAIIMIATKDTALAILRQLHQYSATQLDRPIVLTWMRIHSFNRFSYGSHSF